MGEGRSQAAGKTAACDGARGVSRAMRQMLPDSSTASSARTPPNFGFDRALLALGCLLLSGCTGHTSHEMLNAALWQRAAAEYRAVALQTYALAETRLDEALARPEWTAALEQTGDASSLPPAIVMDLDETIVDNSRYEALIVTELGEYSRKSFAQWCESAPADGVPGAVEFIRSARERGVQVYFYSARLEALRECTLRTLTAIGVDSVVSDALFLRAPGGKSRVRKRLAARHRIVLLVGDSLEDFVAGSRADAAARGALVERHKDWIGRRWIVLPNPIYGHWEALYYDHDYDAPRAVKLQSKRSGLER